MYMSFVHGAPSFKIISKPNLDLCVTDDVVITWVSLQTCIIAPSSIPIHSIHCNHITRQMCMTISIEADKFSVETKPNPALLASHRLPAGDALLVALAGTATGLRSCRWSVSRSPVRSCWSCPYHKLDFRSFLSFLLSVCCTRPSICPDSFLAHHELEPHKPHTAQLSVLHVIVGVLYLS